MRTGARGEGRGARKHGSYGQAIIEYLIIVAAIIAALTAIAREGGPVRQGVTNVVTNAFQAIPGN